MKGLADKKFMRSLGFEDEVFFTLHDSNGVWQFFEADSWMRVFWRDRFVTEIEREAILARLADDTG